MRRTSTAPPLLAKESPVEFKGVNNLLSAPNASVKQKIFHRTNNPLAPPIVDYSAIREMGSDESLADVSTPVLDSLVTLALLSALVTWDIDTAADALCTDMGLTRLPANFTVGIRG